MVNRLAMNIDVREYLRINPISVHELTLSGDGKDCFLYFPANGDQTGFKVCTQDAMFFDLCREIFGGLVKVGDDGNLTFNCTIEWDDNTRTSIISWEPDAIIEDDQFREYVRSDDWNTYKETVEGQLESAESEINGIIDDLMSNSKVDRYSGAIELQTDNAHGIYNDLECKTGLIWATDGMTEVPDGMDDATIGEQPILHKHPNTKAETTTHPFATRLGGSELLGDFSIGSKDLVSVGEYAATTGQLLNPI